MLPSAEVKAKKETAEHISQEQMTERGDTSLIDAIRWTPGIFVTAGHPGFDSGGFNLRGYGGDAHDVDFLAVFLDGVPMIDSYRGHIDYNTILTGGLESIDLSKGYTSVLMGPNSLGGALNIRTAKPKKKFELNVRTGFDFDAGGFAGNADSVTVGTRLGIFYARAGFDGKFIDHWRLPEKFKPYNDIPAEEGGNLQKEGNRIFSDSMTLNFRGMVGVTPLDTLDIWADYSLLWRDKGENPPTIGSNTGIMVWTYDMRHTASFHTEWTPERFNINLHAYFDKSDATYFDFYHGASQTINATTHPDLSAEERTRLTNAQKWQDYKKWVETGIADTSAIDWDKYVLGANLGGGFEINDWNQINLSLQFRQLSQTVYRTARQKLPERTDAYKSLQWLDNIYYGAVEYVVNPFKPFTVVAGFGLDIWSPQETYTGIASTDRSKPVTYTKNNDVQQYATEVEPQWAVGLFYDLNEQHELHLTYAKKHRFPSGENRNAYVTDTATREANPELKTAQMHHFEFGYKGYFFDAIRVTTALWTNYELGRVESVIIGVNDAGANVTQYQNVGETLFYGIDFGTEMFMNQYVALGGALGATRYDVLHSEQDYAYLQNIPMFTANGYITVLPFAGINTGIFENIKISPRIEYISQVYASSYKLDAATKATIDGHVAGHISASVDIAKHYSLSFAVKNITDELYDQGSGTNAAHPGPGRSFTISLGAKF